jgi:hypothetical protein
MSETSLREDVQGHRQFAGYRLQGLSVGGLASRFDFGKLGFVDDAIATRPESQTRPTDERYDVTPTRSDVEFQLCDDVIPDSTSANRVTRQPWLAA